MLARVARSNTANVSSQIWSTPSSRTARSRGGTPHLLLKDLLLDLGLGEVAIEVQSGLADGDTGWVGGQLLQLVGCAVVPVLGTVRVNT